MIITPGVVSIVAGLTIIECLLSIDNALVLATIVKDLPRRQQKLALRMGLAGAYLMRGALLFFVNFLVSHWWVRIGAAIYLLYLMFKNLRLDNDVTEARRPGRQRHLLGAICTVELTDLAFSTDNVVTAVAFSSQFWAVCVGVFIGIAAIRLAADRCIVLVKKIPALSKVAYVLVGSVGVQLILAQLWQIELNEIAKFAAILAIVGVGVLYARFESVQRALRPLFIAVAMFNAKMTVSLERPFVFVQGLFKQLASKWRRKRQMPPEALLIIDIVALSRRNSAVSMLLWMRTLHSLYHPAIPHQSPSSVRRHDAPLDRKTDAWGVRTMRQWS